MLLIELIKKNQTKYKFNTFIKYYYHKNQYILIKLIKLIIFISK